MLEWIATAGILALFGACFLIVFGTWVVIRLLKKFVRWLRKP